MVGTTRVFGAYSAIDSAKPVPIAPTLTVTSTAYDELRITWPVVSGTTAYEIYMLAPGSSTYELLTTTAGNSTTVDDLLTGQLYSFKAVAYSQVGDEKVYGPESAVVAARPVPTAVTGWKVEMPGVSSITLSWTAVTGATGYDITRATTSAGIYSLIASVESGTQYINTGLTFYRYYFYKIRPYTTVNGIKVYGPLSAYVYSRTIPSTPQVTVTNPDSKTNVITWAPISGAQGYVVYVAKGTSTTYSVLKTVTTTSVTHTGVALNSSYKYLVRAYRVYGTTRIYSAYSVLQTILVQYSTNELLTLMSGQLNSLLTKVTSQPVKDLITFTKESIDATRLDPNHDYKADALTAKIMFSALTTSQKAEILLAVILNINGTIIQLLDQRFDVR
jgi:fibronectin type 3 domain-containing protein